MVFIINGLITETNCPKLSNKIHYFVNFNNLKIIKKIVMKNLFGLRSKKMKTKLTSIRNYIEALKTNSK